MKNTQQKLVRQVEKINETAENTEITSEFKVVALGVMKEKLNEITDELIVSVNE